MLKKIALTCAVFLAQSAITFAQYKEYYYNYTMEGQRLGPGGLPAFDEPAGIEDPSFEFPFSERPRQDKIFVSKDFETNDFSAAQLLTRSWTGTEDEERVLGRKFVRINGTGCVANWFPIQPLTDSPLAGPSLGHYVTVHARQDGPSEAIFGINYFDAKWNLIQKNSLLISGSALGRSRGDGDLLKKYTLPVHVPYGASFGQIWIAAPYADGATTFDFLNVFTEARQEDNNLFSPTANLLRNSSVFNDDPDYQQTGYEFWTAIPGSEAGVRVSHFLPQSFSQKGLLLGQPGRVTNIYQVIDVLPNQPYAVRLFTDFRAGQFATNPPPLARGWFGIDFFDSNAKKVDQVVFDISQGESIFDSVYNPVPNVDFAIGWFYVEPLFRDEVIPIYTVSIHSLGTGVTSTAAKATTVAVSKAVPSAVKTKKRAPPKSPITPAIARQAKNSLPSGPIANKHAMKPASPKQ